MKRQQFLLEQEQPAENFPGRRKANSLLKDTKKASSVHCEQEDSKQESSKESFALMSNAENLMKRKDNSKRARVEMWF